MIIVKVWEVMLALMCIVGLALGNFTLALVCVVLLGVQSTLFSPVKLGIIPELVEYKQITNANGTLGMVSNIAIILGTAIAGVFSDKYKPAFLGTGKLAGDTPPDLQATILDGVQLVDSSLWLFIPGDCDLMLGSHRFVLFIPIAAPTAQNPELRIDYTFNGFFGVYWEQLKLSAGKPLLAVTGAFSAFFIIADRTLKHI